MDSGTIIEEKVVHHSFGKEFQSKYFRISPCHSFTVDILFFLFLFANEIMSNSTLPTHSSAIK